MKKTSGIVFVAFFACLFTAALSFAECLDDQQVFGSEYTLIYREGAPKGEGCSAGLQTDQASKNKAPAAASSVHLASSAPVEDKGVSYRGEKPSMPLVLARAESEEGLQDGNDLETIADPLEPINRAFYHFNDKLYFWLLKPVATGYKAVTPEKVRVGVKNIFYNLAFPIRFVNCLLQAKGRAACDEFVRFFTNSTIGMGGFIDVASHKLELKKYDEDLGQTFGSYGAGPGFFINWPIFGPSSVRDTFGSVGDAFLEPLNYLIPKSKYRISVRAYNTINKTSLRIGEYEDLKRAALDPYIAIRDAYFQHRRNQIKE